MKKSPDINKRFSSIRFQIVVYSMGFAILMSLMITAISFFYIRDNLRRNVRQTAMSSLQLLGSEMDKSLDNATNFALWTTIDSTINTYLNRMTAGSAVSDRDEPLTTEELQEKNRVERRLALSTWEHFNDEYNAMGRTRHIQRVLVSTMDGQHYLQSIKNAAITSTSGVTGKIMSTNYFYQLLNADDFQYFGLKQSPVNVHTGDSIIPMVRPIQSSSSSAIVGFVYMELSPSIITSIFSDYRLEKDERVFVAIGEGHKYEYKDGKLIEGNVPEGTVSYNLKNKAFSLYLLPSQRSMNVRMNFYIAVIGLMGFFIICIGLLLWRRMNHVINVPITKLLRKLDRIGKGDFTRDETIEWDSELGAIGAGINTLSLNVQNLMDKKVQDEKKKQELEYQILQSQINPHFLYNTLNTIKWMATIQGSDGIADMSTALSRLLRNISKSKENVISLEKELQLVKDYFTIMKYRYGGTIELEYDIKDETLLKASVNRFSLQPIIENAIFHGIEPKGGAGKIVLSVYCEYCGNTNEMGSPKDIGVLNSQIPERNDLGMASESDTQERKLLIIEVRDDGVGMTKEQIEKTLSGELEGADDFFRHIGVANVSQRIKYTFGEEYGLSIISEVSEYTIMRFTLPYVIKDE
ncbi:putative signal transduction protein [Lachnospiraceae bacterium JC7]|nr:putative signal transduction protein [Lachnospiraceae bacterium JC7]